MAMQNAYHLLKVYYLTMQRCQCCNLLTILALFLICVSLRNNHLGHHLLFANEIFGSKLMSRENNIVITAHWPSCSDNLPRQGRSFSVSVGQVQFFLKHYIIDAK